MNIDKKQYKKYALAHAPKSPILKNCFFAFIFGGGICVFGQALVNIYELLLGMPHQHENSPPHALWTGSFLMLSSINAWICATLDDCN